MQLLPYNFITKGDIGRKIRMGEATMPEYFLTLRQLAVHPSFPNDWCPPLLRHEKELARMAISWDWATCRRWSERAFQMVDGRIRRGWLDEAFIKDLERDICFGSSKGISCPPSSLHPL